MSKKLSLGAALALMIIAAAVTVSLTYVYAMNRFNEKVADVNQRQAMYTKLSEIDQKSRQDYIGKINETALNDGIAAGYMAGLTNGNGKYLSAEKYKSYLSGSSDKNVGVGIRTIQDSDGNMEVVEVFPNSPAEKSGIKKGDVILSIDGREVIRTSYGEAVNSLDGAAGTSVSFSILRKTEGADTKDAASRITVPVTRAEYRRSTLSSSVINGNVGYLSISEFQASTKEQFTDAINSLTEKKVAGLVIDLRNNSGGDMAAMAEVLDPLLPAGGTVSYVNKAGKKTEEFRSKSSQIPLPVSVIVNRSTFGAAELFAADIKDYKRGKLIGEKTAGYGTKDEVLPLSDGSAIMLSVAYYTRINGDAFNGKGIDADLKATLTDSQKELLLRRSLAPLDDPQVQTAVTALVQQGADVAQIPGTDSVSSAGGESGADSSSGTNSR